MYGIDYYEKMLREYSRTAELISIIRWNFIKDFEPKTVLDYGCGCGWFRAHRPYDVIVDSYDIMSTMQTGITRNNYDIVCCWDVIEHFRSISQFEELLNLSSTVALTLPVLDRVENILGWKHFKPGEHIFYFSEKSIEALFLNYDYKCVKKGYPECPPREDILSAIFRKEEK